MEHLTLKERLLLLVEAYRPPATRPWTRWELADKEGLHLEDLRTIQQRQYAIWFDQRQRHYLKAELRRRAFQGLGTAFVYTCVQVFFRVCLRDHLANRPTKDTLS